jgi:hypothetical protein
MDPSEDSRDGGAVPESPAERPIALQSILPGDRPRVLSFPAGTHSSRSGSPVRSAGGTVLVSGG